MCPAPVLFAADTHLQSSAPEITQRFEHFLESTARQARALFLLGDIFEVWVGDDDTSPIADRLQKKLRVLHDGGTQLFFIPGNRDFLLGRPWLSQAGVILLPDPSPLPASLGIPENQRVLLTHGDALCTDDTAYQNIRRVLRNPQWQSDFLRKPLAERKAFATSARAQSRTYTAMAHDSIMDVNQQAVDSLMNEHQADILIHGHTHRPAMHHWHHAPNQKPRQRLVVGDWHHHNSYLQWHNGEFTLVTC